MVRVNRRYFLLFAICLEQTSNTGQQNLIDFNLPEYMIGQRLHLSYFALRCVSLDKACPVKVRLKIVFLSNAAFSIYTQLHVFRLKTKHLTTMPAINNVNNCPIPLFWFYFVLM